MSIKEKTDLIIVNYNSTSKLDKLIKSIFKYIENEINNILIIDNNSIDFDKKNFQNKKIKIIQNKKNLGFPKAVNQGIRIATTKTVILLNPDTYLTNDSIVKTLNLIKKRRKVSVIGGKIFYPDKRPYLTANTKPTFLTGLFEFTNLKKIFPQNKYSQSFWLEKNKTIEKPTEVSSLCGAYLIFKREINKKLNLFNEDYFMYMEDMEFGIKNNKEGFKVIFDPNSFIIHFGGVSSPNKYKTSLCYWYESRKIFFKKHLPLIKAIILNIIFNIEELILKTRTRLTNEKNN